MPYHIFFSTTLLLYKLDTLLLKQMNLPVLNITGLFFRMSTQVKAEVLLFPHSYSGDGIGVAHLGLHLSTHAGKRNPLYPIRSASFVSIVLYHILVCRYNKAKNELYFVYSIHNHWKR